jgi:hypothetical protein
VYRGLPVTGVIHTSDVEVVAISVSQFWAGSIFTSFLDVLNCVRDSGVISVPENRVTIKSAEVIRGVSPNNIDRVITGPPTGGMTGAANPGRVSGWGSIDEERVDCQLPALSLLLMWK